MINVKMLEHYPVLFVSVQLGSATMSVKKRTAAYKVSMHCRFCALPSVDSTTAVLFADNERIAVKMRNY